MDNLRQRTFLYLDDIVNATPFYKATDVATKKIAKLYVPVLPANILYYSPNGSTIATTSFILNSDFFISSMLGLYTKDGLYLKGGYLNYNGMLCSGSKIASNNTGITSIYLNSSYGSGVLSFFDGEITFSIGGSLKHYYSGNGGKFVSYSSLAFSKYLLWLHDYYGVDDIIYVCLDFSKFYITPSLSNLISSATLIGAYILMKDYMTGSNDNKNFLYDPYSELYPFYYEEYLES